MASLGLVLGVILLHFVRLIFSLICIGNILCVSIVVVKIGVVENQLLPPPMKMKEVMFSPLSVYLSVCLSVSRISQKVVDGSG